MAMSLLFMVLSCQEVDVDSPQIGEELDDDSLSSNVVPGRYIVTLHDNATNFRRSDRYEDVQIGVRNLGHEMLSRNNISSEKLKAVYGHAITGFTLELTTEELRVLRRDSRVRRIEPDVFIPNEYNLRKTPPGQDKPKEDEGGNEEPEVQDPEPGTGGTVQNEAPKYLDRIDQRQLPLNETYIYTATGKGVNAYFPPGLIWEDYPEEFEDRVFNIDSIGIEDHRISTSTTMALVAGGRTFGSAKDLNLIGVRTYQRETDADKEIYISSLIEAYDWIVANGVRPGIVQINLVGPIENQAYYTALENLYHAGFSLFSSSGAWMENACTWSNNYKPYVFTVGMADLEDTKQSESNYGKCIDLFAPSTSWQGEPYGYQEEWGNGFTMNPNFVASGLVVGVAAKFLENKPLASPDEVYHFLRSTSTKNIVQLSNSVNNHLLFSGMTVNGAGNIDPERVNFYLDLIGSSTKLRGSNYQVYLKWNPAKHPSGEVDIYENGQKIATSYGGDPHNGGNWLYEVSGRNLPPKSYKICLSGTNKCSNEVTITF